MEHEIHVGEAEQREFFEQSGLTEEQITIAMRSFNKLTGRTPKEVRKYLEMNSNKSFGLGGILDLDYRFGIRRRARVAAAELYFLEYRKLEASERGRVSPRQPIPAPEWVDDLI